jgi:hypothetical protein
MIYQFKSRATGTVVMTKIVGDTMLDIVGKTPAPQGIITVAQMPAAIEALRSAAQSSLRKPVGQPDPDDPDGEDVDKLPSLAQRAYPFIEMLEAAQRAGKDVTWGV